MLLTLMLAGVFSALADTGVSGRVVDSVTGSPIQRATVLLAADGKTALTDNDGNFRITGVKPGTETVLIAAYGYSDAEIKVIVANGDVYNMGLIRLTDENLMDTYYTEQQDILFDENALEDEAGNSQSIGALTGASDNVYYNAANYDFSIMRFRMRGYDSQYSTTYINGISFNDLARGRFNYSMLGGMNRAFRNRTNTIGLQASTYGMGDIGGSANISTITSEYAPGFNGSLAYTNAAYMFRAMAMYSTGINENGWGVTISATGRYANEGITPGTFYNSGGLFLSVEKVFSPSNSLTLTLFGAPTQRAAASATYLEAAELADDYLYNPAWGWQDGKKRSSKIVETFDPTAILNWISKPGKNTTINTGFAVHNVNYSTSALNWYNAADPRPDYYRYLPSYYKDTPEAYDLYTDLWRNDESFRQLNWDQMYMTNQLNNLSNEGKSIENRKGSTYILEDRHSNQTDLILNSTINHRINNVLSMQGGVSANYTHATYYKTMRDLLGGEFWTDLDQFSERDYPNNPDLAQNDLDNPNRRVKDGDKFGYNYAINAVQAKVWLQNIISLPKWDINYGLAMSYTQFQRDGKMRNGRAPHNSLGRGKMHRFDNATFKAGATYKIDGRNYLLLHAMYGSRAPLFEYAYISPRIKDDVIQGLSSERILSGDLSYVWNYRRFRGSVGAFYTEMYDQTERTSFYDDQYATFMNYVTHGIRTCYKGIEVGAAFKITSDLTASVAGTIASYRYKNRPTGVRSYENGMAPDTVTTVYLKNYRIGGTPQTAVNVGLDWAAPKSWFFNINCSYMGNAYVNQSPVRHESLTNLWTIYPDAETLKQKIEDITAQEKLNDAFVLNASIGKLITIHRKYSININLNVDNILNKRDIMTYGYQQGRMDFSNYDTAKYPNKYNFAQGIKIFLNAGIRF